MQIVVEVSEQDVREATRVLLSSQRTPSDFATFAKTMLAHFEVAIDGQTAKQLAKQLSLTCYGLAVDQGGAAQQWVESFDGSTIRARVELSLDE